MSILRSLCCLVGFHDYRRWGSDSILLPSSWTKLVWKRCIHCHKHDILPEDY